MYIDPHLIRALRIIKTLEQKDYDSPEELINDVCRLGEISREELMGRSKKQEYVLVRQATYYLLIENLKMTLYPTGRLIGNRDHGAALHGKNKMKGYLELYHDKITPLTEEEMRRLGVNSTAYTSEEKPAGAHSKKEALNAIRSSLEQLAKDVNQLEKLLAGEG